VLKTGCGLILGDQPSVEAWMPTDRFCVMLDEGRWSIEYCDRRIGPYSSRQDAINAAIEGAQSSGCLGHETEVLVEGEDGRFRTVWIYGLS
jgi:hypothetical protein